MLCLFLKLGFAAFISDPWYCQFRTAGLIMFFLRSLVYLSLLSMKVYYFSNERLGAKHAPLQIVRLSISYRQIQLFFIPPNIPFCMTPAIFQIYDRILFFLSMKILSNLTSKIYFIPPQPPSPTYLQVLYVFVNLDKISINEILSSHVRKGKTTQRGETRIFQLLDPLSVTLEYKGLFVHVFHGNFD